MVTDTIIRHMCKRFIVAYTILLHCTTAVSYTHLDVYKRQTQTCIHTHELHCKHSNNSVRPDVHFDSVQHVNPPVLTRINF